jgi:hypothetical protein
MRVKTQRMPAPAYCRKRGCATQMTKLTGMLAAKGGAVVEWRRRSGTHLMNSEWRVLEMAREPHDNPDKGCHARAPKPEAVSEEGRFDIINLHIGGRSPDTSYLISLTTNPIGDLVGLL